MIILEFPKTSVTLLPISLFSTWNVGMPSFCWNSKLLSDKIVCENFLIDDIFDSSSIDWVEIPVGVSENSFLWMEVLNSILSFPIDDHKIHHQLVEVNYVGV